MLPEYKYMKASYTTLEGSGGTFEAGVIMPQPMQQKDGFTLLGFKDWEAVNDEKLSSAVTEIAAFELHTDNSKVGFYDKDKN